MSNIRLHPKHGVNPTLGVCIYCGKDDGTIGLLGFNKDREAPRRSVLSTDPCAECKAAFAQGIPLFEGSNREEGECRFQANADVWLSGRVVVMTEDWVRRTVNPEALRDSILRHRKALLQPETFEALFKEIDDVRPAP